MYNTGYNACRLACELYSNEEIYMIGFDIFGDRNNLYDNTNGYYSLIPYIMKNKDGFICLINYIDISEYKYKKSYRLWTRT